MSVPTTVRLFGYVKDLALVPIEATKILIRLAPVPQYSGSTIFSTSDIELMTDENGYFSIKLPCGIGVTVIIPAGDYQISGVLPVQEEMLVTDLDKQPTKIVRT
jgi:hypothetical protein